MGFLYDQLFITPTYPTKSFTDQIVIVTGSNVGLGREAARHYTRLNAAKVILAVRNPTAGEDAKNDIETSTKRTGVVEVWDLDLGSYASVKAFAAKAQSLKRIDVLMENAGIAPSTFRLVEADESTITVNVVSTFLLGLLLLPKLQKTASENSTKSHMTIVSSEVHGWVKFEERNAEKIFASLSDEKTAKMSDRYPLSKLLEILVLRHIAPSVASTYPDVVLNSTTPGLCHSSLSRDGPWFLYVLKLALARSTEVGSRTELAASSTGTEGHGKYLQNGVINEQELSEFVRSEEGAQAGEKVWAELREKLESISDGVTKGLA